MKQFIILQLTAPLLCCAQQFNPYTNAMDSVVVVNNNNNDIVPSVAPATNVTGIPCNPNTFWANDSATNILEFELNGNIITSTGTSYPCAPHADCCYANNLNNSPFSPTFYSHLNYDLDYFNGSTWPQAYQDSNTYYVNCGGHGNFIYGEFSSGLQAGIGRYTGTTINMVYAFSPGRSFAVADVAVDFNGNAYFFTGAASFNPDSLMVTDSSGNILAQYYFPFMGNDVYGSFILNNTLYLGLGYAHPVYPNTLIPVTFSGTNAIAGTPIPFPGSGYYYDLESCNQGLPLGIPSANATGNHIYITNPVKDICTVKSGKDKINSINIYDMFGNVVFASGKTQPSFFTQEINCTAFAKAIYVMSLQTDKGRFVKKFVKE